MPALTAPESLHPSPELRAAWCQIRRSSSELIHRIAVVTVAITVAVALSPWLIFRACWGRFKSGSWLTSEVVLGRHGRALRRLRFSGPMPGAGLASLWHVATGDYEWIGPRAVRHRDLTELSTSELVRLEVAPGLVSLGAIRQKMGLAHDGVAALEHSMAYKVQSLDLGMMARAVLATCLGSRTSGDDTVCLFGVDIDDRTMASAVDELVDAALHGRPQRVAFVNPDCLNKAYVDDAYRSALCGADRVYADGIGIRLAAGWRGQGLRDNVNGTDLFPRLCERAAQEGLSMYLLGARPGVAERAATTMVERYPGLQIVGTRDGYFGDDEEADVRQTIRTSGADIVLVAFGAPRQELWIEEHHAELGASVALGVGGLFDFYSGRIERAPQAWRDLGLEWLFRLTREPGRLWRRYVIGNPLFVVRTVLRADRRLNTPRGER
ncbi:MAG: WecB/TagA/CpsF family glycosyltransferase [Acidobacteriota bacterium]